MEKRLMPPPTPRPPAQFVSGTAAPHRSAAVPGRSDGRPHRGRGDLPAPSLRSTSLRPGTGALRPGAR